MTSLAYRAGRLWRTVRWLRREQWLGRVATRLRRRAVETGAAPGLRATTGPWVRPPARTASLVGPAQLHLLGESRDIDAVGWDDPAVDLLWRYNQHYFDDLLAEGAAERVAWQHALIDRWCAECAPGRGTAWSPYPTSLRIVNWAKWHASGQPLQARWLESLATQARWLSRHLEWHLLGNHLFANAKALTFAGLLFDGPQAQAWLDTGLRILHRELPEQILSDGGQFERSPMYHVLALEDVLDLINMFRSRAPAGSAAMALEPGLASRAASMLTWMRCLQRPDGTLVRFNDCADGVAPATAEMERYASALGIAAPHPGAEGVTVLEPSGYRRVARGAALAWLDLAPVGPDYLPGHAHADTLSFELAVKGRAVIVNRGTSVYGTGARRHLERGTAAHSTLQLGEHDSSEVWSGFRVGRRARVFDVEASGWELAASHDGYRHLPGRPVHRRRWIFGEADLVVEDLVKPAFGALACARFHLAPGLRLRQQDGVWHVTDGGEMEVARVTVSGGRARAEHWEHAVGFGSLTPAETLAVDATANAVRTHWTW